MGYNTVAVLLNDQHHRWAKEIQDAERNLRVPPQHHPQTHFGYGAAISCEHADSTQVVLVKRNGGERIQDAEPDAQALWLIGQCGEQEQRDNIVAGWWIVHENKED